MFLSACSKSYHTVLRKPTVHDGEKYGRFSNPISDTTIVLGQKENVHLPELEKWVNSRKIKKYENPEDFFSKTKTLAFIILKKDSIIYENYYNGSERSSVNQLFSITKTITATMLGWAIEDGFIKSVEQKVSEFLPQTKNTKLGEVKLSHLLNMSSGINYNEYRNIVRTLKFYYQKEYDNICEEVKMKKTPGKSFAYKSIDTQILSMCIENATFKNVDNYFFEKVWNHLGPIFPSYWSVDSKECSTPKYYGGFNAAAIDLIKFGAVYANNGIFSGEKLVPEWWVDYCEDEENRGLKYNYCNAWWASGVDNPHKGAFYGAGFGGQYLYIDKLKGTVIVRLGEGKSGFKWGSIIDELNKQL